MRYAYLFEAKSIQSYIFATNRLKEIVGASELIESITSASGLLLTTIEQLELDVTFSRCGGGAFYVFGDAKTINTLKQLWPLLIRQHAPNLEFIHASAAGKDDKQAFEQAHQQLLVDRNKPKVRLPSASVFAHRCRRTGEPASALIYKGKQVEAVDIATKRKLKFQHSHALAQRFDPESKRTHWPINLTPVEDEKEKNFPFQYDSSAVALIHADGNGLGQLLINLKEATKEMPADRFVAVFYAFSQAITQATEEAAQQAVNETLAPHKKELLYPARPIVLGGDDLTIIVRADLAISFTHAFLAAFEKTSVKALKPLITRYKLSSMPNGLTACAGVVYAKASQPFYLMHELAEGLCKHAKTKAKAHGYEKTPSALSFHKITTALTDDYQHILEREMTAGNLRQTLECYALDTGKNMPVLTDLLQLQSLLQQPEVSKGATRQLLTLVSQAPEQATQRYKRWREVMHDKRARLLSQYEKQVEQLLASFHPSDNSNRLFSAEIFNQATQPISESLAYTPFADVITLLSVDNVVAQEKQQEVTCHTNS